MMLPVVLFIAFRDAASLKFSSSEPMPEATIANLLITDVSDADVLGDSKLGAGTEKPKMVRSQQQSLPIEVDHFAKCGGTYVQQVAKQTIKTKLSIVREFGGNAGKKDQRAFTLGMIRNPFSYLVSIWTYGSHEGGLRRYIERVFTGGLAQVHTVSDSWPVTMTSPCSNTELEVASQNSSTVQDTLEHEISQMKKELESTETFINLVEQEYGDSPTKLARDSHEITSVILTITDKKITSVVSERHEKPLKSILKKV